MSAMRSRRSSSAPLLTVFSWRDVVLMNVMPGVVMSALILVYIGRLYKADEIRGVAKKPVPMASAERLRVDRGSADAIARW